MAGVTNIRLWVNLTDDVLEVWKYDHGSMSPKNHYWIHPHTSWHGDMWIPWAHTQAQYESGARAVVQVGERRIAYMWQSGYWVRYSLIDRYSPHGNPVPGDAHTGGDRSLTVTPYPNGTFGIELSSYG